jgi:hypothetical protein
MIKNHILQLAMILLMLFAGCTHSLLKPPVEPEIPVAQAPQVPLNDLNDLMHYYSSLLNKSALELAWEYNYANNHYRESMDSQERLKFLILLLLPDTHFRNVQAALDILENPPQTVEFSPNLAAFEKFLVLLLKEQQSASSQAEQLSVKLRATETQVKILQDRIDAIKNIEKNLLRRNAL